ncbi:MAG: hypothetical protein WD942_07415 [Dehalococcoidia bacterium]
MNRRFLRRVALLMVGTATTVALAACGGSDDRPMTWDSRSLQATVEELPFIPSVINSSVGVGESRIVVAFIDRDDGTLVGDATVTGTFYRLANDPDAEPEVSEAFTDATRLTARVLDLDVASTSGSTRSIEDQPTQDASLHRVVGGSLGQDTASAPSHDGHEHQLTTVYTTNVTFDQPGYWGLALRIEADGQTHQTRLKFWVMEHQGEIAIGAAAPRTAQLTLRDVDEPAEISSAPVPNTAMLEKTVAEALDTGRPVVVAFVTPAFCQTRYCGPILEAVVEPAWQEYGDRVEFVHIEPFDLEVARGQGALEPVPAVVEWGLRTEPFIFVVDAEGLVRYKLEGITDLDELSDAIEAVLN